MRSLTPLRPASVPVWTERLGESRPMLVCYVAGFGVPAEAREAVKRGRIVNKTTGEPHEQLHERHDASDFEQRTADRLEAAE